jgi:transposase
MAEAKRVARRMHGASLKAQVLEQCGQPGASVAQVAMAHGLNANLVHRWRRIAEGRARVPSVSKAPEGFLPVPIGVPPLTAMPEGIRIELRRGGLGASVEWPVSQAASCAIWLRELLR